jgi:type III pantothenate kinase
MLLAIDIGNTNMSFGLFERNRLVGKFDLPAAGFSLKRLKAHIAGADISSVIICSVVPRLTAVLTASLKGLLHKEPLIIGKNVRVPIKNLYRHPRQVGQDRLVNAFSAATLYATPLIAIDFGTAITFDVISRKKEYLGGMILPGLNMSLKALHLGTALLPEIKFKPPKEFIGRDTENSILSGIVYGVAALTDELVRRIKLEIGNNAVVVGTGGSVKLMKKYCRVIDFIDADLTLKGLNLIFNLL